MVNENEEKKPNSIYETNEASKSCDAVKRGY